jgi:gamma-glutamyltranspeptidase / glutathione hydrolase
MVIRTSDGKVITIDHRERGPAAARPDYFDDVPSTQALYLDLDGTPHDVGTVLRNPDLARTYERIARLGAKGFCRGAVADAMVEAVQHSPVAADADFFDVPLTGLLSDGFAAERRALIDPQHAATSPVPPGGNGVVVPGWGSCSTTS